MCILHDSLKILSCLFLRFKNLACSERPFSATKAQRHKGFTKIIKLTFNTLHLIISLKYTFNGLKIRHAIHCIRLKITPFRPFVPAVNV